VQVYVSRLRKVLSDGLLVTQAPGYVLRVDPDRVDVHRFERLVKERRYDDALALWRGPPLAEFSHEPFAQAEIARLEELRLAALEERAELDLAQGRHAELVGELERLIALHPLRERLRGQLMLALYRSGRQAEALEVYQAARRTLVDGLGIEPGPTLQRLERSVLAQDPELEVVARPAQTELLAPSSVFVGRDHELAELVAGLEDAFAGRGRLFLLSGEPGIGKSRLTEELAVKARARGARVLFGRCWEAGGAPAYWPWVQSLRAYMGQTDPAALRPQLGAGAAVLAQILPDLRQHFSDVREPPSLDSEAARFRLFDATAVFLRNASEARPIVLALDDLHAADTPSLLLLQFIARELGSSRMLVIAAYRDVYPNPGPRLTEMLAEVTREPVTRRLALTGLAESEVAEFTALTATELASSRLAAAIHEETEGNPLFVGELVRLLAVERGPSEATGEVRLAIPPSVRDVIARRLTYLSEECNRILALASVLGREFALEALAHLAGVSVDQLFETLDEAVVARIVAELPGAPGRLRFTHVVVRDTLYQELTPARRVRLHRDAVVALEALYGEEPGPFLAELAHHCSAGRDFEKAIGYAERAADRALAVLAYEEAARLYATALDALAFAGRYDESARCELLLALGDAQTRGGDIPSAKTVFLEAADLARGLGAARAFARAAAGYAGRIPWERAGHDDRLAPLLEEALDGLADQDVDLRVRLLARLAGALRDEHSADRREALSSEAVELARGANKPAALVYALDGRAAAMIAPDTLATCVSLSTELRDVAESIGDVERVVAGYSNRFVAHVILGEMGAAEADLDAQSRLVDKLRQPSEVFHVLAANAMLALARGRLDEGEALAEQAFAVGERAQPAMAIPIYRLHRYTVCDFRGRLEEVEGELADLVAAHPARPVFRCVLAHVHVRLGRSAEARKALADLSADDFSPLPFDQEWLYATSLLAETCGLLGENESAAVLYRLLAPRATLNAADPHEGIRGSVSRYLGLLATTMKRWDEADRHFEDALGANERMGFRPWLAHTQRDYARMLLTRTGPGDRERAAELLDAALVTYRELGMEPHVAEASALARSAR
jgi:tetratricopeptide (TPR) repeat protein